MAAQTKYETWEGIVSFAKIHPDNPDSYNGVRKWTINFHPKDETVWKAIEESGCQRKIYESTKRKPNKAAEEYGEYIRLDRPVEKVFKRGEEPTKLTPVEVQFFGKEEDFDSREWFNGSKAEVTVEIYGTDEYVGTRLVRVNFTDPVTYDPEANKTEDKEVAEQATPTKKSKEPKAPWA